MARHQTRVLAACAIALGGVSVTAAAQSRMSQTNAKAPRLMVGICRNPDKKLGPDAAEAVRDRIGGDVSPRDLYVFPAKDITSTLASSGYSETDALSKADASALTKIIHADMDIECAVIKTATGFQIQAWMTLQRDANLEQPLGTYENAKLDGAAAGVAREFRSAFRTFEYDQACRLKAREGKTAEALKAASDGIAAYPKSIWMRVCQLGIAVDQKKPAADIIKIAEEIRAIDPKSQIALKELFKQYDVAKNAPKKIEVLMELYNADPSNPTLQRQVANELAAAGQFDKALPIIAKAVAENQGDVSLVQTYFNVLGALGAPKDTTPRAREEARSATRNMVTVGASMIQMDTSLADQDFFDRMVSAYVADSNYLKAAEWAARGTAKFPNNALTWLQLGNLQRRNGQTQQSIVSLKRALALDPKTKNARLIIIQALVDMNQYDSALVAMHEAVKAGEDVDQIGFIANVMGNRTLQNANKAEPKIVTDYQKVLPYVFFADSIAKDRAIKNNAKFLIGVTSYYVGSIGYKSAVENKSCEGIKAVNAAALDATLNLPIGGATNAPLVQQLMPATQQLLAASEQGIKAFCKADGPAVAPPTKRPGTAKNKNP